MKRWPNRAEVCLEAGKMASRGKTKRENCGETAAKRQNPPREENSAEIRGFSAACLAAGLQRNPNCV